MSINLAYLELRLSGGASNADPSASLGGIKSSEKIVSKTIAGISNITGVTALDAPGLADGAASLAFTAINQTLTLTIAGAQGASIDVSVSGRYAIPGTNGFLFVDVTAASLPAINKTDTITITQAANELFDNISKAESWAGDIEYRGFYIHNAHDTEPFYGARIWINSQPTGEDDLMIGLDNAGIGDGGTTGVAVTIADEAAAPASVAFSAAINSGSSLSIGQINPGDSQAVWLKRTVPAETTTSTPSDISSLAIRIAI